MKKILDQIKHQIAKDNRFCDWKELLTCCTADMIEQHWNTVVVQYVKELSKPVLIIGHSDHIAADHVKKILSTSIQEIPNIVVDSKIEFHSLNDSDCEALNKHKDKLLEMNRKDFELLSRGNFDLDSGKSKYHK